MIEPLAVLDQAQSTAITLAIQFGPKLLVASLILILGFYVARWLSRMSQRLFARLDLDPTTTQLLERTVRIIVFGLFLIMALQNLGVELLPLIAGLGHRRRRRSPGHAGRAQQPGSRPDHHLHAAVPGRRLHLHSSRGRRGRTITLFEHDPSHPDLSRVVIPNRKIAGEILHNYGRIRQLNVHVGVAYGTDMNRAIASIEELLHANPRVLDDPAPLIQVATLADFSVTIAVKPWVKVPDYPAAIGEVNQAILENYRAQGIAIPYPQREVRLLPGSA